MTNDVNLSVNYDNKAHYSRTSMLEIPQVAPRLNSIVGILFTVVLWHVRYHGFIFKDYRYLLRVRIGRSFGYVRVDHTPTRALGHPIYKCTGAQSHVFHIIGYHTTAVN